MKSLEYSPIAVQKIWSIKNEIEDKYGELVASRIINKERRLYAEAIWNSDIDRYGRRGLIPYDTKGTA